MNELEYKEHFYIKEINSEIKIGVMDLCMLNGQLYVTDGQHRMTAIKKYYDETNNATTFYAIIYTVKTK